MGKNPSRLPRRSFHGSCLAFPSPAVTSLSALLLVWCSSHCSFQRLEFFLRTFSPIFLSCIEYLTDIEKVSCYCWKSFEGHSRKRPLSFRPISTLRKWLSKDTNNFSFPRLSPYESFNFSSFISFPFIMYRWKIILELILYVIALKGKRIYCSFPT